MEPLVLRAGWEIPLVVVLYYFFLLLTVVTFAPPAPVSVILLFCTLFIAGNGVRAACTRCGHLSFAVCVDDPCKIRSWWIQYAGQEPKRTTIFKFEIVSGFYLKIRLTVEGEGFVVLHLTPSMLGRDRFYAICSHAVYHQCLTD